MQGINHERKGSTMQLVRMLLILSCLLVLFTTGCGSSLTPEQQGIVKRVKRMSDDEIRSMLNDQEQWRAVEGLVEQAAKHEGEAGKFNTTSDNLKFLKSVLNDEAKRRGIR